MSGRIRSIKPELLDDAVTAGLSDMAFRLFIAAIVLADDYGRLRAEPGWLTGQVYWAHSVDAAGFRAALESLSPLVHFYEVNGQRYAEIRNWSKHQKVSHPGKPRVPPPSEPLPRSSGESPETLVPDLRSPIPISDPDHRPPTGWREEPQSEVALRRFDVGTAGAQTARAVFEESVSEATGKQFALTRAPFHDRDLVALLNTHGPPKPAPEVLSWLRPTVEAWVRSTDPRFSGGWAPSKLLDWLNSGRPDRRDRPKSAAEATKQPFDPKAPWIKIGDTGT